MDQATIPEGYTAKDRGNCRSCGAPIQWAESPAGKPAPFDPDGTSHFATCPQAPSWRKDRKPTEGSSRSTAHTGLYGLVAGAPLPPAAAEPARALRDALGSLEVLGRAAEAVQTPEWWISVARAASVLARASHAIGTILEQRAAGTAEEAAGAQDIRPPD